VNIQIELDEFRKLIIEHERLRSALSLLCCEIDSFMEEYNKLQGVRHNIDLPYLSNNCTQDAKKLLEQINEAQ
jgi:hypothetical protein